MLCVAVSQALDNLPAVEQAVEEVYQQVLVGGGAEDALETAEKRIENVSFFPLKIPPRQSTPKARM